MNTLTDIIKAGEVCVRQGNFQAFRIINTIIDQELKRRNKEDSSILDRILIDIRRFSE